MAEKMEKVIRPSILESKVNVRDIFNLPYCKCSAETTKIFYNYKEEEMNYIRK